MIGRIYKIIDTQSDLCYVGSTCSELKLRWHRHKQDYKKWTDGKARGVSIYPYFRQFGIARFKMIIIKQYMIADKTHLSAYEQLWINKLNCVNKVNPFYIPRLSNKKRYEDNKEVRLRNNKAWRDENRERRRAQQNEKHLCDCGVQYTQANKSRHGKTKAHLAYFNI